jgi:hypothetical protein
MVVPGGASTRTSGDPMVSRMSSFTDRAYGGEV